MFAVLFMLILSLNFQDLLFTYMPIRGCTSSTLYGCLQYVPTSPIAAMWDFRDVPEQRRDPLPRDVPTSKCKPSGFTPGLSGSASHLCRGLPGQKRGTFLTVGSLGSSQAERELSALKTDIRAWDAPPASPRPSSLGLPLLSLHSLLGVV